MQLFYSPDIHVSDTEFTFDSIESKHIVRVLRKKEGDVLNITNGQGTLFKAKVKNADIKQCSVHIVDVESRGTQRNYYLHLAIAPTKNNDRLEWFLEKATEIGVDEITPIYCKHSERRTIKFDRLKKIIETAGKQSLKFNFPKLNEPTRFLNFIQDIGQGQKYLAHCDTRHERKKLSSVLVNQGKIVIAIGPEGDFSTGEIENANALEFVSITLGNNRLRTETAGLVAVHTCSVLDEIKNHP